MAPPNLMLIFNHPFELYPGHQITCLLYELLSTGPGRGKLRKSPRWSLPLGHQPEEKLGERGWLLVSVFYFWGGGVEGGLRVVVIAFKERASVNSGTSDHQDCPHLIACWPQSLPCSAVGLPLTRVVLGRCYSHSGTRWRGQESFLRGVELVLPGEKGEVLGRQNPTGPQLPSLQRRKLRLSRPLTPQAKLPLWCAASMDCILVLGMGQTGGRSHICLRSQANEWLNQNLDPEGGTHGLLNIFVSGLVFSLGDRR